MNGDPVRDDREQQLTPACRAFLRAGLDERALADPELRAHVSACAFCSRRRAFRDAIAPVLARPAEPPPELGSAAFLDRIRTRICEAVEAGPVGRMLQTQMPVEVPSTVSEVFPDELLENDLARHAVTAPRTAPLDWARVKATVLEEVASRHARRPWHRAWAENRSLALAGVAAAAIICTWLVVDERPAAPEIVITDVVAMPDVDILSPMAVLRRGESR